MSASPSPWAAQEDALSRVSALAAEGNIAGVRALSAEAFADPWHLVHCSQAVAFSPVTNDDSNLATNSIQLSTIVGSVSSVVDWILHRRADLSCWDSRMRQVIHHAAASASALLVLLFCHLGVDLETKDRLGRTPLALAVESGDAACIAALLMNGASMAADSSSEGASLLDRAASGPRHRVLPVCGTLAAVGARFETRPFLLEQLLVKMNALLETSTSACDLRRFSALQTVKIP